MGFTVFVFVVMFVLIASGGLILFYREAMLQRITAVIRPTKKQGGIRDSIQEAKFSVSGVVEKFERLIPKNQAEVSVTRRRMISAGYRETSAVNLFYGAKVLMPAILCVLVLVTGLGANTSWFTYIAALGVGFIAPDFWLGRRIAKRQKLIRLGLPDVLDLLVICIEAGLSQDQATARTAEELRQAQPAICDELGIVVLEQRAGRPRSEAWTHFAERTGVPSVRSLASVLIQSEQFGTSVAKTLRIHSDALRVKRRQLVEEQAAKTTIKLIFPLVFFIFPSLFLVTLGPAAIVMQESFQKFFK